MEVVEGGPLCALAAPKTWGKAGRKAQSGPWVPALLFCPPLEENDRGAPAPASQEDKRGSSARAASQGSQRAGPALAPSPAQVHSEMQVWLAVPGLACHCCVGVTALGPLCLGLFVCLSETGLIRLVDCLEIWNEGRNSRQSLLHLKYSSSQRVLEPSIHLSGTYV